MTPDQNPQLLPCAHCGENATFLRRNVGVKGTMGFDWWHSIQCVSCHAAVGYDDNRFRDKSDAIKAWNLRAVSPDVKILQEAAKNLIGFMQDKEEWKDYWKWIEAVNEALAATEGK